MSTDREFLKMQQAGALDTSGATDPIGEVGRAHEDTFLVLIGADASFAEVGFEVAKKCKIKTVKFTPSSALAANGTSYTTYTVAKRDGAGGAAVSLATTDTNTAGANVSLAAFQATALALTATKTDLDVAANSIITAKSVETGTPVSPLGFFTIVVEYV